MVQRVSTADPTVVNTPFERAALRRRRRSLFLGTLTLMAATVAFLFGRAPVGGPTNAASAKTYQIPLTPGSEIAQTFTVPWSDFRRLRLQVTIIDSPAGALHVAIDRMGAQGDAVVDPDIRQVQMNVRPLVNDEVVEMTFPVLPDSAGQRYRLRASIRNLQGGTLALTANRDNTYLLGSLYVDGREQPGDLVFVALSSAPTTAGLLRAAIAGRPWPFSSPVTFWCLMALFCVTVSRLVVLAAEMTGAL